MVNKNVLRFLIKEFDSVKLWFLIKEFDSIYLPYLIKEFDYDS